MRQKLKRFEDNKHNPFILEPTLEDYPAIKKQWSECFDLSKPLVLEVGAGKGDYTIALATKHPEINVVGIDLKGDRLWHAANKARDEKLENVRLVRIQADHLAHIFPKHSVSEIWITFPGPRPKKRDAKKRLTHKRFLDIYDEILKDDGVIHLKTDNAKLYFDTYEQLKADSLNAQILEHTDNLYQSSITGAPIETQTHFEKKYLAQGMPIHYLKFHYRHNLNKNSKNSVLKWFTNLIGR